MTAYDFIGLVGSCFISAALIPQISKVYRTKSATDISYPFLCMYITGLSLLATYGIGESLWPIYIPSSIELLAAIGLLSLKVRYDKIKTAAAQLEDGWNGAESPKRTIE